MTTQYKTRQDKTRQDKLLLFSPIKSFCIHTRRHSTINPSLTFPSSSRFFQVEQDSRVYMSIYSTLSIASLVSPSPKYAPIKSNPSPPPLPSFSLLGTDLLHLQWGQMATTPRTRVVIVGIETTIARPRFAGEVWLMEVRDVASRPSLSYLCLPDVTTVFSLSVSA
jgi:hypothetical protein